MGLETATYVDQLVITNPEGGDDKRQGDDHLCLIKKVLKNTFKRATKAFYPPGAIAVATADAGGTGYVITEAQEGLTFSCNTTAGFFTLKLPVLDSTRYGWKIRVVRTAGTSAVFIQPLSGVISSAGVSYAYIRRSVSNVVTEVEWIGVWVASRPNALPIGAVVEFWGTSAPDGYLLCDGSAVNSVFYLELSTLTSTLPNHSGRTVIGRDTTGAGLVTPGISGITATALGSTGGAQSVTLGLSEIPSHSHTLSSVSGSTDSQLGDHLHGWGNQGSNGIFTTFTSLLSGYDLTHTHPAQTGATTIVQSGGGATNIQLGISFAGGTTGNSGNLNHAHDMDIGGTTSNTNLSHAHGFALSGSTQSAGSSGYHINVQPSIVMTKIIVAE